MILSVYNQNTKRKIILVQRDFSPVAYITYFSGKVYFPCNEIPEKEAQFLGDFRPQMSKNPQVKEIFPQLILQQSEFIYTYGNRYVYMSIY